MPKIKVASSTAAIAAATRVTPDIAVIGIDIGKYTFHVVALDRRGRVVLRQKFSRTQLMARLANTKPDRYGSVRRRASFGAPARQARPRHAAHAG